MAEASPIPTWNQGITREGFEKAIDAAKAAWLYRLHQERPGSAVAWIAEV